MKLEKYEDIQREGDFFLLTTPSGKKIRYQRMKYRDSFRLKSLLYKAIDSPKDISISEVEIMELLMSVDSNKELEENIMEGLKKVSVDDVALNEDYFDSEEGAGDYYFIKGYFIYINLFPFLKPTLHLKSLVDKVAGN